MELDITFTLPKLAEIVEGRIVNYPVQEMQITSVAESSRHKQTGSIFIAAQGLEADGHDYIDDAFNNGSVAVAGTDEKKIGQHPGMVVKNSKRALSRLAAVFAGEPSKKLMTIGITGTNGKTTIHWILYHALARLGYPGIRIGSLGIEAMDGFQCSGKVVSPSGGEIFMTTPSAPEIQNSLKAAVAAGLKSCVLETSSHALDQYRVADIWYDLAVFSNLTQDHLNYHPDMAAYFNTKVELFRQVARQKKNDKIAAVVNSDDPWGQKLIDIVHQLNLPLLTFGKTGNSAVRIKGFDQQFEASTLTLIYRREKYIVRTPFFGNYNASNMAAAFSTCLALGFEAENTANALTDILPVPGRLESVGNSRVAVLVDYAHTGEGLQNVLSSVRGFVRNKLWVVFGCGGGKDPYKRAAMGKAAMELADKIVLTADNPKNEDLQKIIDDILTSGCKAEFIEIDRAKAIERTLRSAEEGDVVVPAGKGHEDYQILGNRTYPFSDREEVLKHRNNRVF